jgi:hypothetical protein
MNLLKPAVSIAAAVLATSCFAQASSGTITNGTNSNAEQSVNVNNQIGNFGSGSGSQDVTYHGTYTMKNAPTVYAPSLTASMTETCWGSVSAAVSVVGVGATGAATIKDYDCNRRLNAAVAWRMGRQDVAFNLMCQDTDFRKAAEGTDHPCRDEHAVADIDKKPQAITQTSPSPTVDLVTSQDGAVVYRTADIPKTASK